MELLIEIGELNCRFGNFYWDYHTTCQACPEGKGIWKKLVKEVCFWNIQKSIQRPIRSSIPDVWFKTINNETVYCWRFTTLKSYPLWWYLRVMRHNVAPHGRVCQVTLPHPSPPPVSLTWDILLSDCTFWSVNWLHMLRFLKWTKLFSNACKNIFHYF